MDDLALRREATVEQSGDLTVSAARRHDFHSVPNLFSWQVRYTGILAWVLAKRRMQHMAQATILLVDDEGANHSLFAEVISRHLPDCVLRSAFDAEEGFALARSLQPDCAVVDAMLPDMNGIPLCRKMKAGEDTAQIPILLITPGEVSPEFRMRGLESGADDFVCCLCTPVDLAAKIRLMLKIKHAEDEFRAVNKRLAELAAERSCALRESEECFRLLFNACSDGVFIYEFADSIASGRFLDANEAGCLLLGYSREELLQRRLKDLFPASLIGGIQGRIDSILTRQQVFFETVLLRQDGRTVPVAMTARVFARGPSHTIIAVVRSLTESGDLSDMEREAEARYRTIAAQTGQMIYDADMRQGVFKWGGAVTQVTGYTLEEVHSFTPEEMISAIHEEDRNRVTATLEAAMDAVSTYQIEYRIRHKSGEYRHVENLGVALPDEEGRAYRLLGTIKDITARVKAEEEQRRLERETQHSQKLESLGVLAGGIAHDFNNILAAIIGLTDMALHDIPPDSATYTDLQEALQAAHRAKELVKQILMFSRQSGEERTPIYLHVVVREALKLLRASLPATIEIIDNVDVASGAVLANPVQMHQVVMNYCTNAAQAMNGKKGVLEVRLTDVEVDEKMAALHPKLHPGPYVKLSVSDTGHGMEPGVMNRIFDPFFTTKGPGEGTGMGLAVVHGIVSNHGGVILVESVVNKGSVFHTFLPRICDPAITAEMATTHVPQGREHILFVDDEEGVRHFGKSMLPRLGYQVTVCKSGAEALRIFKRSPEVFDIVVTDYMMPRMTGEVLAASIRRIRPEIPVILFTGFSNQFTEENARKANIQDVVMKPIIGADLARRIRQVLDGVSSYADSS